MVRPAHQSTLGFPGGFTLVEALVAVSMTALAGSVLLLGATASFQNTDEALRQTVALGLAQQLIDEVLGGSIAEIDAFDGFGSTPPVDRWGVPRGSDDGRGGQRSPSFCVAPGMLDHYGLDVRVSQIDPSDLALPIPASQAIGYRLIVVRVTYNAPNAPERELARLQRVVTHVPPY